MVSMSILLIAPVAAFQLVPTMSAATHQLPVCAVQTRLPSSMMVATSAAYADASDSEEAVATPSWVQRLNKISTLASILCAIDCTVFPILLAVLPLINVAGPSAAWLHEVAHAVALYFVGPIGGAAVASNALQHRNPFVLGWGLSGVSLVFLANIHLPHAIEHLIPHAVEDFLHMQHSLINVMGCALLLSSQRYSHRPLERMGKCCGHDHSHDHAHHHD